MIISFLVIYIFDSIFVAINRACNSPSLLESQLIGIVIERSIIKKPTSRVLIFPVFLKLNPGILLAVVLHDICLAHLLASDHRGLFDSILTLDVVTVETSHLVAVEAFMELVVIFVAANSSAAWTFLVANDYADIVDVRLPISRT